MLKLLCLNLLESKMVLPKIVLREADGVSYYGFKHVTHSPFGRFICESKGFFNTWMTQLMW